MSELLGLAQFEFVRRALVVAFVAGILCSTVSFFVVLRRLAFVGVGVSHSAFAGIAIGLVTGLNPVITGSLFAVAGSWAVGFISRKGRIHEDTAIGIFFASSMALGVLLVSISRGYYGDLFGYLFGNILTVSDFDLMFFVLASAFIVATLLLFFKELMATSFNEELAKATGLPVETLYFLLMTLIAVTTIVAIRLVGMILASALLVIPAATGCQVAKGFRGVLVVSIASGVFSAVAGLLISCYWNLASGASIVLLATALFMLCCLISRHRAEPKARHNASLSRNAGSPERE